MGNKNKDSEKKQKGQMKEADVQRIVLIGTIVVVVLVVGILSYAVINENVLKPNHILVEVGDKSVSVKDFQEYAKFSYALNYGAYPPDQLMQFGVAFEPAEFSQSILDSMVEDIIIEQKAEELGIDLTTEDAIEWIQLAIGYDAGDPEPTATATEMPAPTVEPSPTATFVITPTVPPTATMIPDVTPTITPTETVVEEMEITPEATPEPLTEEDYEDTFSAQVADVASIINVSEKRVREMWIDSVYHYLLRQEVMEQSALDFETTKIMVRAAHILVKADYEVGASEEEIEAEFETAFEALMAAKGRIDDGEEFAVVAADVSEDTSALKGGDLGWSTPDRYVPEFASAVTDQEIGVVGEPVKTSFGWHLIQVLERETVDLSQAEMDLATQEAFNDATAEWVDASGVDIGIEWINYIPDFPA